MTRVVAIDVGGTRVKGAVFDDGVVQRHHRVATPRYDPTGAATADVVARLARELADDADAVGLAAPGVVDADDGVVVYARNLGWTSVPLRKLVASRLDVPVYFGHDVRLGGRAEHARLSPADQAQTSMFVPVGTGISVSVTTDGVPASVDAWSGEIGGMRVSVDPARTLEEVASAAGIARRCGRPDGESVLRMVLRGDPVAVRIWDEAVLAIAEALAWGVALHSVQHVIIGGGLSRAGSTLTEPLGKALEARLGELPEPRIHTAVLGDLSGCYGAAMIAQDAGAQ